jgi:hypothetical protein
MKMDPTRLVRTAQCGGWGTGRMKLAQRAQRQRLRQNGMWAVGCRSPKTQDSTSCLRQDLDPGWGGDDTILTLFSLSPMTDTAVDCLPALFLNYCTMATSDNALYICDRIMPWASDLSSVP